MKYKTLILCTILASCTVGQDYTKPEVKLPEKWHSANGAEQTELQNNWWKNFNDPILEQLIEKTNKGNLDLKIAEERIAQARASQDSASTDLLPHADAKIAANRQANQFQFAGAPPAIKKPFNTFQTGFDASWELDLFGGKKRDLESAKAELDAAESSRDNIKISLLAEVARNYINIRQHQAEIVLANDIIASNQKTLDINNKLFKSGLKPKLDVIKAESELNNAKSQLPKYEGMLAQAEYATDILIGEQAGATHKLVSEVKPIPATDKEIILSAPASIIANRPDVKIAERKLAAATAQQGSALAKFFPDISLSGFLGLMSVDTAHLVESGSKSWAASGGVLLPILNYGKLSANMDAADSRQHEALAEYQKSIISALSDVETSVNSFQKEEEHKAVVTTNLEQKNHEVEIANNRYKQGQTSFLEVLDAKRSLFTTQQELLQISASSAQNMVAVYKSLGGAWKVKTPAKVEEPAKPAQ